MTLQKNVTLLEVYKNFNDYNFIIKTNDCTIDTTKYNYMYQSVAITGMAGDTDIDNNPFVTSGAKTFLLIKTDKKFGYPTSGKVGSASNPFTSDDAFIILNTQFIRSIQVKSVRGEKGFLLNQRKPTKK